MTFPPGTLVFDTGPLRHFAQHQWLGVLGFLAQGHAVVPESVWRELDHQVNGLPVLRQVLEAPWLRVDRRDDIAYLAAFAKYENRLARGRENLGECGVLALGEQEPEWVVVLDDHIARGIAEEQGMQVISTLNLLCKAIRDGRLTVAVVEHLADELLEGDYYLPFSKGGFRQWAIEEGHLDYA